MPSKDITALDINGHTYEITTEQLSWRPSAYGIVIKDGKLLLLKQQTGYDLPGGGAELGETCEEAVVREVKEESGIDVANPRIVATSSSFFKLPREADEYVQSLMLYYVCDYVGGELSTDGFDEWEKSYAEAPEWYPLDKLDELQVGSSNDFRPYVRQLV